MISLLSLLLTFTSTLEEEHARLLHVQIILGHAALSPTPVVTSPEYARLFPSREEAESNRLVRMAQLGAAFQLRYAQLRLLRENTSNSEIYVRSSPINQSLMSAFAFALGFTGNGTAQLHLTESIDDEKIAFSEISETAVRLDSALRRDTSGSAGRVVQFRSLSILPDDHSFAAVGPLMAVVSRSVGDVVGRAEDEGKREKEEKEAAPVRVYCTKDEVFAAAVQALGIASEYEGKITEVSSAIAIETWSTGRGFEIKVVTKDGIHSPFAIIAKHSITEFEKMITPHASSNETYVQWDEQGEEVYTFLGDGNGPKFPAAPRGMTTLARLVYQIALFALMVAVISCVCARRRLAYARLHG